MKRALVVDDEPDILEIVSYNLKNEGYIIHTASNGLKAIEKATKHKPHLILLDIMMPEMDGIEACEKIRNIEGLENTIISFLSARGEDYSQVAGFDAGADDYITKPIKPKVLVSKVKSLLRRIICVCVSDKHAYKYAQRVVFTSTQTLSYMHALKYLHTHTTYAIWVQIWNSQITALSPSVPLYFSCLAFSLFLYVSNIQILFEKG